MGSRVKNDNSPRADIDIGIEGPQKIPSEIKLSIEDEIEQIPTLYRFDIVDFKTIDDELKNEALKYIEPII